MQLHIKRCLWCQHGLAPPTQNSHPYKIMMIIVILIVIVSVIIIVIVIVIVIAIIIIIIVIIIVIIMTVIEGDEWRRRRVPISILTACKHHPH